MPTRTICHFLLRKGRTQTSADHAKKLQDSESICFACLFASNVAFKHLKSYRMTTVPVCSSGDQCGATQE